MSQLSFMLAKEYSAGMKTPKGFTDYAPLNWLMSEKLDGYRARFNPVTKSFVSRQNKPYNAPQWFTDFMPKIDLDGELFCGRDGFQKMGSVRKNVPVDKEWFKIKYYVYDAPEFEGAFSDRYKFISKIVSEAQNIWSSIQDSKPILKDVSCPLVLTMHYEVQNIQHMKEFYYKVLDIGGEGIMLKDPQSMYENKRSNYLLKYKPNFDAEAIIIGYKPGSGKYSGKLGSFICQPLLSKGDYQVLDKVKGHEFATSGMDDAIRESYKMTHPIGTIVTYEYSGFTNKGKPRFARYIRIRDDISIKEEIMETGVKGDKHVKNCIQIFKSLSKHEKMNGEGFKSGAYNKAVKAIEQMKDDSELTADNLLQVKGIGQKIVEKVMLIIDTGTCPMYDNIKDVKDPKEEFMKIHSIGPVKANKLVKDGFTTIKQLTECENIGEYLNETQIKGLTYVEDLQRRIPYEMIQTHEKILKKVLETIDPTAELTIAGSYRRKCKDSGDIDVLIKTPSVKNNSIYKKFIDVLSNGDIFDGQNYMQTTLSLGPKKFMGVCQEPGSFAKRIDIMFTKPEEYPFAILYFTGSKDFNTNMRKDLLSRGLSLNEYSLKDNVTKKSVDHVFVSERDIFDYIKYEYVEPENR